MGDEETSTTSAEPIVLRMGDPEVAAMGCIQAVLEDLDAEAAGRILRYFCDRYAEAVAI